MLIGGIKQVWRRPADTASIGMQCGNGIDT
jgi:hypothetical protein